MNLARDLRDRRTTTPPAYILANARDARKWACTLYTIAMTKQKNFDVDKNAEFYARRNAVDDRVVEAAQVPQLFPFDSSKLAEKFQASNNPPQAAALFAKSELQGAVDEYVQMYDSIHVRPPLLTLNTLRKLCPLLQTFFEREFHCQDCVSFNQHDPADVGLLGGIIAGTVNDDPFTQDQALQSQWYKNRFVDPSNGNLAPPDFQYRNANIFSPLNDPDNKATDLDFSFWWLDFVYMQFQNYMHFEKYDGMLQLEHAWTDFLKFIYCCSDNAVYPAYKRWARSTFPFFFEKVANQMLVDNIVQDVVNTAVVNFFNPPGALAAAGAGGAPAQLRFCHAREVAAHLDDLFLSRDKKQELWEFFQADPQNWRVICCQGIYKNNKCMLKNATYQTLFGFTHGAVDATTLRLKKGMLPAQIDYSNSGAPALYFFCKLVDTALKQLAQQAVPTYTSQKPLQVPAGLALRGGSLSANIIRAIDITYNNVATWSLYSSRIGRFESDLCVVETCRDLENKFCSYDYAAEALLLNTGHTYNLASSMYETSFMQPRDPANAGGGKVFYDKDFNKYEAQTYRFDNFVNNGIKLRRWQTPNVFNDQYRIYSTNNPSNLSFVINNNQAQNKLRIILESQYAAAFPAGDAEQASDLWDQSAEVLRHFIKMDTAWNADVQGAVVRSLKHVIINLADIKIDKRNLGGGPVTPDNLFNADIWVVFDDKNESGAKFIANMDTVCTAWAEHLESQNATCKKIDDLLQMLDVKMLESLIRQYHTHLFAWTLPADVATSNVAEKAAVLSAYFKLEQPATDHVDSIDYTALVNNRLIHEVLYLQPN